MEGNACYKFSTISRFVEQTNAAPIRLCLDIGANIGDMTLMLASYFPAARIHGFEAVRDYFVTARSRTEHISTIRLHHRAVTAQHRFKDDLGTAPLAAPANLRILRAVPEGGPGWLGGSMVATATAGRAPRGYEHDSNAVRAATLDQVVSAVLRLEKASEIDIVKIDCEGCEHSCLGCASVATLERLRYITGEYHGIERFFRIMRERLFRTHRVALVGDPSLGSFFAERIDSSGDRILCENKDGMLQLRPWLAATPLEWHIFNEQFVARDERKWHGLS